jgi:ketosteroid isomerase-like protein
MHSWVRVLCGICFAVIIPSRLCLGADQRAKELEVKVVEQRWLDNENRADVVQSILADDFVHVLAVGFISKNDHLAYLRQHPNAFPGTKHFEELRVRIYGDIAIATGIVSTIGGSDSKPKSTAFTDVFILRAGSWLAVNAQELPLETKPN